MYKTSASHAGSTRVSISKFYSIKDLRLILGIGKTHAYNLAAKKIFPMIRINGRYYFPKEQFDRWVERHLGQSFEC